MSSVGYNQFNYGKVSKGKNCGVFENSRLLCVGSKMFNRLNICFFQKFTTVKLGNKERFDKEQIGIKELIMDYQTFYTINLLLDKELLPIQKMSKLGIKEHEIVKISKKRGLQNFF